MKWMKEDDARSRDLLTLYIHYQVNMCDRTASQQTHIEDLRIYSAGNADIGVRKVPCTVYRVMFLLGCQGVSCQHGFLNVMTR
jgi:hypothetical protein